MDRVESLILRCEGAKRLSRLDILALEEPLEIRLGYDDANGRRQTRSISITMRTPGHDAELALGFLLTEGIIWDFRQIDEIKACGPLQSLGFQNVIRVELKPQVTLDLERLKRHFYTSSSCGVCGKTSIAALKSQRQIPVSDFELKVFQSLIYRFPAILEAHQENFSATGGLHASALFSTQGKLLFLREDVGRHNALDKLIGCALQKEMLPLEQLILMVSGRASFELIQKANMAGIQMCVAVGAPSSLAVELAREQDMTLIGFLRNQRMNIYHGSKRVLQERNEHEAGLEERAN